MMKGFGRIAALLATGLVLLLMLAAPAAVMAQQPEGAPGAALQPRRPDPRRARALGQRLLRRYRG